MSGPVGEDTRPMKPVQPPPQPLPPPPPYAYAAPQPVRVVVRQKPAPKKRSGVGCGQLVVIVGLAVVWVLSMGSSSNTETNSNMSDLQQSQTASAIGSLIADQWRGFSFVESVGNASNRNGMVYGEVRVVRGFVNEQSAEDLRQAAIGVGTVTSFSVILDDGVSAADFVWNRRTMSFTRTPINTNQ